MLKYISSLFFTILFVAFISAPTFILLVDDTQDVSLFYSMSEEEEKGHETLKNIKFLKSEFNNADVILSLLLKANTTGYCFKTYPKPHLNLISPPPEQFIL